MPKLPAKPIKVTQKTFGGSGGTGVSTTDADFINTDTSNFDSILSAADTNVQLALETLDDEAIQPEIMIHPLSGFSVIQGVWGYKFNLVDVWKRLANEAPIADLDEINYSRYLSAGTYDFEVAFSKGSGAGIIEIIIDGITCFSLDTYSVGAVFNDMATQSAVILTTGYKTIRVMVNGKNGSSSDYGISMYSIRIGRTA